MVLAVLYHDVVEAGREDTSGLPGAGAARYKLTPAAFREHLRALASALPARPGTAADLLADPAGTHYLLTFDDGGVSAGGPVADLLEEHGWRGHFLVTADFIGTPPFLAPGQIRDLRRRGHVIGSHSCSHPPRMALCPWPQLVSEWGRSCAMLADILGEPVTVASVPGGFYSRRMAEAAAQAGVRLLFNSEPTTRLHWVDGCLVVGRYTVYREMTPAAAGALVGRRPWRRLRQALAWKLKKVAKAVGGHGYLTLRERLLRRRYPGGQPEGVPARVKE
jgi:peptidoglycan/xylan/chitin deacetylase (PgdA/CDA1 family)